MDRFWSKVERGPGCWEWKAVKSASGYGVFRHASKNVRAHRFSYELCFGTIPSGLLVCHKCDNRSCVNPLHLFLGTKADNSQDMVRKGRGATGERHGSAKLAWPQVVEIRNSSDSSAALARKYGVSDSHICKVRSGKKWAVSPFPAIASSA